MHQIRYFLAVSKTLNFTRAARECNVTQPSLTRAIQKLEDELGGPLFCRERSRTHLSELGLTTRPLLEKCFESAMAAKAVAESVGKAEIARLRLGISNTVTLSTLAPSLGMVERALSGLELQVTRGTSKEIEKLLEQGRIEIAVTASDDHKWERIEHWRLFTETFRLIACKNAHFASKNRISLDELGGVSIIWRSHCEQAELLAKVLSERDFSASKKYEVSQDADLFDLVKSGTRASFVPKSVGAKGVNTVSLPVENVDLTRSVYLLSVSGRKFTTPGQLLVNYLTSTDWSALES